MFLSKEYPRLLDINAVLTWWEFALEHVHGYDVDDEHPDGAVQQLTLGLDEGDGAETLTLETSSVRVGAVQLPTHVGLELLHVEQLNIQTHNICKVL